MDLMEKFADPSLIDSMSMGDKMLGSTITMIMGMGITFCVLVLLWLFVKLMGKFINREEKEDKSAEFEMPVYASEVTEPTEPAPEVSVKDSEEEIAAVIAAAIAAYRADGGTGTLVVRKISRASGNATAWSNAAKADCIQSRKF